LEVPVINITKAESYIPNNALLYTIIYWSKMLILNKTLKNTPTCFDHYSDHLQGALRFLVKVTEFKNLKM